MPCALLLFSACVLGACTAHVDSDDAGECMSVIFTDTGDGGSDAGQSLHASSPIPPQYADLVNPYSYSNPQNASLGAALYASNCASCHGSTGHGDGPLAANFCFRPSDLNVSNELDSDPYLFWRISDGPLPGTITGMPAFGATLTTDDIWRIITTIRLEFTQY